MSYLTPNMSLLGISIGVDSGITIEQNLNSDISILDQHNHSPGSGVQIQPSGINISSDLEYNSNGAVGVGFIGLSNLGGSPSTNTSIFSSDGVDLYFLDGDGNIVQMTSGGSVLATSSGISSGTNSASFVSNVLVVNVAANTPANIQCGSILLGNNVANTKFLTLSPPAAMAANFTLTLPSIPASQSFLTIDTSGNIAAYAGIAKGITAANIADNTITTNQISLTAGITGGQIAANTITRSNEAAVGQQVSSSCGNYSLTTAGYKDVTNLSVTITTTGRPVMLILVPDGSGANSSMVNNTSASVVFNFTRASTILAEWEIYTPLGSGASSGMSPSLVFLDVVAAGTYTYKVQAKTTASTVGINLFKFVAYEL